MTEAGVKLESTTIPEIKDAGKLEQPKSENTPEMAIPSDKSALIDLLGQETTDELVAFYTKIKQDPRAKPKSFGDVSIPAVTDRAKRSKIHTVISATLLTLLCRLIFSRRFVAFSKAKSTLAQSLTVQSKRQLPTQATNVLVIVTRTIDLNLTVRMCWEVEQNSFTLHFTRKIGTRVMP